MRKVVSSYILTIISLSLVLFLLGLYLVITSQSSGIIDSFKEKINVVIELSDFYVIDSKTELMAQLKANDAIITPSIKFLTKEDAKKLMVGEDELIFMDDSLQNPFRDAIVLNLRSDKYEVNFLKKFSKDLESYNMVSKVYYQEDLFQLINSNLSKMGLVLLFIGVMMLLLAVSLIYNTVSLTLIADENKIQTMELVGAERKYIRHPYIWSALKTGLLSFFLSISLLSLFVFVILFNFELIQNSINYLYFLLVILLLLLLGVFIPVLSTKSIVNRYLNKI